MNLRLLPLVIGIALCISRGGHSADPPQRSEWDQAKAEDLVNSVLRIEATGEPWDRIPWIEDPDKAAKRAIKENKPILVYFYLKKNVGPAAAPG